VPFNDTCPVSLQLAIPLSFFFLEGTWWEDGFIDEIGERRNPSTEDVVVEDARAEAPSPGDAIQLFGSGGDGEVGVDGVDKTGHDGSDGDHKDEPGSPVPTMEVSIDAVGVVHVSDVELLFAKKVEIANQDAGDRAHEARVSIQECKKLSGLDNDCPWIASNAKDGHEQCGTSNVDITRSQGGYIVTEGI